MNNFLPYIFVSVIILAAIIMVAMFRRQEEKKPISRLALLAFGFILAGIIFGDSRFVGYGLIGTGVIIALIDIIIKSKRSTG